MSNIFTYLVRDTGGEIPLNIGDDALINPIKSQGLNIDELGQVYANISDEITHYSNGLPFTAQNRLAVSFGGATERVTQAIPFNAEGRVLFGSDDVEHVSQGIAYSITGGLTSSVVITPGIMLVGTDGDWYGFSLGQYGELDPDTISGFDQPMVSVVANPAIDTLILALQGSSYQPGVGTIIYDLVGTDPVVLTWDTFSYTSNSAGDLADFLAANVGEWVDGVYQYQVESPVITQQPVSEEVEQYGSVFLTVVATDNTPSGIVNYQWYENDVLLGGENTDTLEVTVGVDVGEVNNYKVEIFNDGTESVVSDTVTVTTIIDNLYINWELVGGALSESPDNFPPDDHSLGFNDVVTSAPIDNGDGTFNWHSNTLQQSGRQYLSYLFNSNNPVLEVGATYRIGYDVERTGGSSGQVFTFTDSSGNLDISYINRSLGSNGSTVFVGAQFTVLVASGHSVGVRCGTGVSSTNNTSSIAKNPVIYKISEP